MVTILLGLVGALAGWFLGAFALESAVWGGVFSVLFFLLLVVPLNFWNKKRMERVFNAVQEDLQRDQTDLRRRINQMQNRMGGATKGLQKQLEKKQQEGIRRALEKLENVKPLYKWNILAKRQVNTMRAQLCYQIGEMEEADRCLQKCLSMDPFTVALKISRAYKNDDMERVEKLYKRNKRRFKGDKGELLHCLYAWVLVKKDRVDDAVQVLNGAREKLDSEVIEQNWEHLVNGRVNQFSNAGLGDSWYALQLEVPKQKRAKRSRSGGRKGGMR